MKKRLLLFTVLFLGAMGSYQTLRAATPASATWALTSTSTTSVTTAGQMDGVSELLSSNLGINQYTGTNTSQRVRVTAGWPANQTTEIAGTYIEFAAKPKVGCTMNVNNISMSIGGGSINYVKANIYYSTNADFSNSVKYYDGSLTYLSSTVMTSVVNNPNINLDATQTLYVRVYPWVETLTAPNTGKYFVIQNVVISGSTEPVPVSSSIIWPCIADITSSVTSGTIMSGGTTAMGSNLLRYGSLTYSGQAAQSIYTGSVWVAETAPQDGRYIQFAAAPKSGGTLVLDSVKLKLAAWATNDFRVSLYYSTNSAFDLATGTKLGSDISVTSGNFSKTVNVLSQTVNSGEVLYLRLYPYSVSTTGDQWKLVGLDSISVFGKVTGVTADPAIITTTSVTNVSTTFVTTGGTISSDGGAAVTDRGIVYSATVTLPTINDMKIASGTGSGSFTTQLSGLAVGTTYYARAYATNSTGTTYGSVVTFTTMATLIVPVLTTASVSSILAITATSGGNVSDWGGSTVTARGICWSTSSSPTIADGTTTNGSGLGSYACSFCSLLPYTTYYVRAYATNSTGTGYGSELSFTTQALSADVNKVVDKDGSGDYTTIQAAFTDVPDNYAGRWIIHVKPGTYYEKCTLAAAKSNVFLIGEDPATTIITYNAYAGQTNGAGGTWGTNGSFSVAIDASDFQAQNITFQNTQKNDGSTGTSGEQAVALRTKGDRQQYYNCRLLGYQDTYYTNSNGRIYMKKCYIEGSVDFIFGNGVMVLDSCTTYVNRDGGVVCAPNTDAASSFGYVFLNCNINSLASGVAGFNGIAMSSFYLGRPWQNNPKAAFVKCVEPATLNAGGWINMTDGLSPVLSEYQCTGAGSAYTSRSTNVNYKGVQLTDPQALNYTISNVFAKTTNSSFACDWMPVIYVTPVITSVQNFTENGVFILGQNNPNPFNTSSSIKYSILKDSQVTVTLINLLGAKVATLVNDFQISGDYQVQVNRQAISSGIYYYTLQAGNYKQTKKMMVK